MPPHRAGGYLACMQDCSSVLRQIEQYEEHLHVACLAPTTGRVVPLRCEAFTGLYDTLLATPALEALARRLVHSHWAANAIIERLAQARAAEQDLRQLAQVRHEIHGQLRALRRSLVRRGMQPQRPKSDWLRAILFRPLR